MKSYFTHLVGAVIFLGLASSARPTQAQTYQTVALTGFTADVIANGPAANLPASSTTDDVDGVDNYFNSQDYYDDAIGIPDNGTIKNAITGGPSVYQLASLSANNSLRLFDVASGTLTFATPTAALEVYILGTSGSGNSTVDMTVNYADGTSTTFTDQSYPDWYTPSTTQNAFGAYSRVNGSGDFDTHTDGAPFLDQVKLTIPTARQNSPITSITFAKASSEGVLNVMAVSIRVATPTPAATPLPVQLASFAARRSSPTMVALTWTTASEVNNAGFAVQRSADGSAWVELAFVPGAGSSTQPHTYAYTETTVSTSAWYYRLRQVDQDGTSTYSPVQVVPGYEGAPLALTLYPNPTARGLVQVRNADPAAPLRLLDVRGYLLHELPAGTTSLDTRDLPTGLYLLRSGQLTQRLLVQ